MTAPRVLDDVEACVDALIARVGRDLRIGLPLGLGKPAELVNALYARAKADPSLSLTLLTALTLEKPVPTSKLEAAFLQPFLDRVFAGVVELEYAKDVTAKRLPKNVRVIEFFFRPGSRLGNAQAQRDYISTNYTFAARDVFAQGCNVAVQVMAKRETADGTRYSLSCNPDTGPELVAMLRDAEARGERKVAIVGVVNENLPYMALDAEVEPSLFDLVVDHPRYASALFSTPKTPVVAADYAIGLQASALVRDGGTLQIGIGALGDAIVHALKLRHADNDAYTRALEALGVGERHAALVAAVGGTAPFARGLYGATEMFVDGFWHLLRAGILSRAVYDFWALQQIVNDGTYDPSRAPTLETLEALEALGVRVLRTHDFEILQRHGFFNDATRYDDGYVVAPDGTRAIANLADPATRRVLAAQCLGTGLKRGIVLHGGFFLGPRDFYQGLRDMTQDERDRICMSGVDRINQLDRNPRLYKAQRIHARFVNTGMMATLGGSVVSDGLADGRVVSGVGGQYNFVAMA
ncbi:MAG TPA: acetyl-CoA hydrolase/transferase C-terminal domain-containing protein, partial [Nevskiaceae bacterium]|nr:acetyl-CoA hydrolase/transferase C-terminal domain-containing protein [Nevskiaceae bacterium]